jgi:hypothetical protein
VRLPLGVHRRTGRRYPLLDQATGEPLRLVTPGDVARQMAFLLAYPRVSRPQMQAIASHLETTQLWSHLVARAVARTGSRSTTREAVAADGGTGDTGDTGGAGGAGKGWPPEAPAARGTPGTPVADVAITQSTTTSAVIRWVDDRVSPLDLLDELCPASEMGVAGQGFIGWCPFHDGATRSCRRICAAWSLTLTAPVVPSTVL